MYFDDDDFEKYSSVTIRESLETLVWYSFTALMVGAMLMLVIGVK